MIDISAKDQIDLIKQLESIDISVPSIEQERRTEHCEQWSICRLLASIVYLYSSEFPIQITKRERPDFFFKTAKRKIGIEITEAIQPDYARARVLPEASIDDSIIDPSLFKWGTPKKSLKELRTLSSKKKLTGPGWDGDEIEVEWSKAIFDIIKKKSKKLISKGFQRYSENWLSIYDNLNSFSLNIRLSIAMLSQELQYYWSNDSFDKIYVETGELILIISKERTTQIILNDLWK